MLTYVRPAVVMLALFTVMTGLAYPLAVTGIAQVLFRDAANGSVLVRGNAVVGSTLIGQSFTSDKYFHGRRSATSAPDPKDDSKTVDAPYNAASSSGSNLGPTSKKLIERVEGDVVELRKAGAMVVPADAVTTSASGLDPHVSPAYAELQIRRVAAARGVDAERIRQIAAATVVKPAFGYIGEPRVNILLLNLALDAALGSPAE